MAPRIRDLRAAIIGHGFIAGVHIDALRRLGVSIEGLLGSSFDRASRAASDANIPRAYHDLSELAADERIDVVHVTSPNHAHADQVLALLAAGKHVVCEKPLAMTVEQARLMAQAAQESGKVAAICFTTRFFPMSSQAKAMVDRGQLGELRLVTGHHLQDWLALDTDWNWRLDPAIGGVTRAIGDIGSHWIDLVEWVTGDRIDEVMAEFATFIPVRKKPVGPVQTFAAAAGATHDVPIGTEDAALVLLRFASGARGQLTVSQISQGHDNESAYELSGAKESLAWESGDSDNLWLGHRGAPNELLSRDPSVVVPQARGWLPAGHVEGLADAWTAFFREVYSDVAAGMPRAHPRYATFADGLRGLEIEEAIVTSARQGVWVTIGKPQN